MDPCNGTQHTPIMGPSYVLSSQTNQPGTDQATPTYMAYNSAIDNCSVNPTTVSQQTQALHAWSIGQ